MWLSLSFLPPQKAVLIIFIDATQGNGLVQSRGNASRLQKSVMELQTARQERTKAMPLHGDTVVRIEIYLGVFQINMLLFVYTRLPNRETISWCLHNKLSQDLAAWTSKHVLFLSSVGWLGRSGLDLLTALSGVATKLWPRPGLLTW